VHPDATFVQDLTAQYVKATTVVVEEIPAELIKEVVVEEAPAKKSK
jgi:chemotaxis regulatin CheY-phosphate phosphatase CheZ